MTERIAKYIADSGVASRRNAETLIESGLVTVNGKVLDTPVYFVQDSDVVAVNNKIIQPNHTPELYAFHKPLNIMTTTHDPEGRKTIYDILPQQYRNLKYVGRLDYKTTGLLLMTNSGELAQKLTLPSSHIPRTYIATVNGNNRTKLDLARRGITVDGIKYRPMEIDIISDTDLKIRVTEGKKNEIRIVLRACGAPVRKLHRISFGPIELGNLAVGEIKKIEQKTIDALLKTV